MSRAITAFPIALVGTGINAVHNVTQGKDPFPTLIAGTAFGVLCVGVNTASSSSVGTLISSVFLLSAFLTNGVTLLTLIQQGLSGIQPSPETTPPKGSGTW